MKIRDLFFLVIGGLLVVFGMVLNSVLVTDANADKGSIDTKFGKITCREIIIEDENGKKRGEIHIDNNKGCKISFYNETGVKTSMLGEKTYCDGVSIMDGKEGECRCCF